jgi:hypothetical protein
MKSRAQGLYVLLAAALLLLPATTASSRGVLGLFAGESEPAQPAPTPPPAAETLPSGRPVAWISGLRGVVDPAAVLYSYVNAGQTIDLGGQGEITLTYLTPCREETIAGGVLRVMPSGPQAGRGSSVRSRALSCRPLAQLLPDAPASTVPDEGPFDRTLWAETAVNAAEPIFRWPAALGDAARLTLTELDGPEPREVWAAKAYSGAALYPEDAPPLQQGRPYLIRAVPDDGAVYEAVFSLDPDLTYSNAPINGLVLLHAAADGVP